MGEGRRIEIRGTVQGVGFRPWVYRLAHESGITGRVRNDAEGVFIDAFGAAVVLDAFLERLRTPAPPAARVRQVTWSPIPPEPATGFVIVASRHEGPTHVSIPADLATCDACLREVFDPSDRRYRYPFTNCTDCGPRFTIALDVPYDRARTTMAPFEMCPACRSEYEDPLDRRFHAQPNACPACGPRLRLLTAGGETIASDDPLAGAAVALGEGRIVAVKGLGGYHLACDATDDSVVHRLRLRKRRDRKPFAVMVPDLASAAEQARLSRAERDLLRSVERPIVLVRRRPGNSLADAIAPGSPLVGLMLAYTPLHHLLLREAGLPLVMTSANLSEQPIVHRDDDAVERLADIADLILSHDREIASRCDDSVARVVGDRALLLRRSRGYVPVPVAPPRMIETPILGCGAQLKNTFCLAEGDAAWLGPHLGDLDDLETYAAYEEAIERMERFLGIRPRVIAHDLHPDYLSTRYAASRPEPRRIAVQHHHAHVASLMAEHGIQGPVLGLAWDGTGHGPDASSWGGELLWATCAGYRRLATVRPIRLPGGDSAVREPWRTALALLEDAFYGDPPLDAIPLFQRNRRRVSPEEISFVREMLERDLRCPPAHGIGRYFDALGALALEMPASHHEGEVALAWNLAADPDESGLYPWRIGAFDGLPCLDLRPMVRAAVGDLLDAVPTGTIAGRFHNTLAEGAADLVRRAARHHGGVPVGLTGGCFQNDLLSERLLAALAPEHEVLCHGMVPAGDGGIALGQVVVADAVTRGNAHGNDTEPGGP